MHSPDQRSWQERMPCQLLVTDHDNQFRVALNVPTVTAHAAAQAIFGGRLEGDMYRDGEIWVNLEALCAYRLSGAERS